MRIVYVKANRQYRAQFQVETRILEKDGVRLVKKHALDPRAQAHLENMFSAQARIAEAFPALKVSEATFEGDELVFPFVEGTVMMERVRDAIESGDEQAVSKIAREYAQLFESNADNICGFHQTDEFVRYFGNWPQIEGARAYKFCAFDMTWNNVIRSGKDDCATLIDYEWCLDFPVPVDLVKYHCVRSVYDCFSLEALYPMTKMLEDLGVALDDAPLSGMKAHFNDMIFHEDGKPSYEEVLERYRKASIPIDGEAGTQTTRINMLLAHISDLKAANDTLSNHTAQLEAANASLDAGTVELRAANDTLSNRVERLEAANASLDAGTAELRAANDTLSSRDAQLEAANASLEAGTVELRAANDTLLSHVKQLEAANASLEGANVELRTANDTLSSHVEQLEAANTSLDAGIVELRAANDTLSNHVAQLEAANKSLDAGVGELRAANDTLSNHVAQVEAGTVELRAANDSLSNHVAQLEAANKSLDAGVGELRAANVALSSRAEELECANRTLSDQLLAADENRNEVFVNVNALNEANHTLDGHVNDLQAANLLLSNHIQNLEKLNAELADAVVERERVIMTRDAEMRGLRVELAKAQTELSELEKALESKDEGKAQIEQKLTAVRQELFELQSTRWYKTFVARKKK